MKRIDTKGITFIEPVPEGTAAWYYGISHEQGDLYEAEEISRAGRPVSGNALCLIRYPEGEIFLPVPRQAGTYFERPVFLDNRIYILNVDFLREKIRIFCFNCGSHQTGLFQELPLAAVKNCYNLKLHVSPLCLTRQGDEGRFEILWPEETGFRMDPRESFFLREDDRLYFSRWNEEGEGPDYRYWEETVIRDLKGEIIEILPGDIRIMPNGEMWHLE